MLTFNPGWNEKAENLESYDDIRAIQNTLKTSGIEFIHEIGESTSGPGSFMIADPDGNIILIDQHR